MRRYVVALRLVVVAAVPASCPALAAQDVSSSPTLPELASLVPPVPLPAHPVPSPAILIGVCASGQTFLANGSNDGNGARPVGDLAGYRALIQIVSVPNGFVRARASAEWPIDVRGNVLGFLRTGSYVWAEGPLKNGSYSAGLGWAVPVRDLSGRECRAYVSSTVVRVLFNGPMTQSELDRIIAEQRSKHPEPSTAEQK